MKGTSRRSCERLTTCRNVRPSMSGIITSQMIRSGARSCSFISASRGSSKACTSKSGGANTCASSRRMCGSSSTTTMRLGVTREKDKLDRAMSQPGSFLASSIGRKAVMAITGLILFGFVIGHLVGNLQVYQGPEKLNHYAELLRRLGPLLWVARITLLVSVLLHIWAA